MYKTVFIAESGFNDWPTILITLLVPFFIYGLIKPDFLSKIFRGGRTVAPPLKLRLACVILALFMAAYSLWVDYSDHLRVTEELQSGHHRVVAGQLQNFIPESIFGHDMEQFSVGNKQFSYADDLGTPGYHRTAASGGFIKPGVNVRISYVGNTILKLEVADDK